MNKGLFLVFNAFLVLNCSAQVTFEKYYYLQGSRLYNISPFMINTADSGYYIISYNGDTNVYSPNNFFISLTRLDKRGKVLWNKNSDKFTTFYDANYGLGESVQYADSSLVILWNDQNSKGLYDRAGFIHTDKNGNAIWGRKYICPANRGYIFINSLARTYDNGLIGSGTFTAIPSGLDFRFLLKTDSAGNIQWCKQYFPDSVQEFLPLTEATRIALSPDSGFFVTFGAIDSISSNGYGYLMKTDRSGNVQWAKRYNPNVCMPDFTKPQINKGQIILTFDYNNFYNIDVLKTDLQGVPIWNAEYSGANMSFCYDGITDQHQNTILSGLTNDNLGFIFTIDSTGNILWSHKYGSPDSSLITNLLLPLDGGVLGYGLGPSTFKSAPSSSLWDVFKTDAFGHNGCELAFPVNRTIIPLVWQNVGIKAYPVSLTQKDTILNFSPAPIDTITICAIKPILKPIARIYRLKDTICNGTCLCYTDSSANSPSNWEWIFTGATPGSSSAENPCNICYSSPGKYQVMLIASNVAGSDTTYDSIFVVPAPTVTILGKDSICSGDSTTLTASPNGLSYLWSTGNTNQSITIKPITDTGYYVQVSNLYCSVKDSIKVVIPPFVVNACCDTTIYYGQSVILKANGGSSYAWAPSTGCNSCPNTVAKPSSTTTYTVSVANNLGCSSRDSVTVNVICRPVTVCCDSFIVSGGNVQLSSSGGTNYYWSPSVGLSCDSCSNPEASPTQNTTYTVTINDSGCISVRTITIEVTCGNVFVPNAFSPNKDGQNDILYVRGTCISTLDFVIFDRWGNKVFESQKQDIGWDGTYGGKPMNAGTFVFHLAGTLIDGSIIEKEGDITLIR